MLNGLDLFSGIGGLTVALGNWVRPVAYCENDRYCQSVLLSRMADRQLPSAPIWDDITSLSGAMLPSNEGIQIIYGGFPCQDISVAGNGAGLEGKRSGLVKEVYRLIEEIRPIFVFLENVPAIRTRGAFQIGLELSDRGYDQRWDVVSAAEVGAPHLRQRWFLLAANPKRLELRKQSRRWSGQNRTYSLFPSLIGEKTGWPLGPEVCRMDDGPPHRLDRHRALGNSVVPLQAREAFKRLMGLK